MTHGAYGNACEQRECGRVVGLSTEHKTGPSGVGSTGTGPDPHFRLIRKEGYVEPYLSTASPCTHAPALPRDAPEVDEWEALHRAADARAILNHRSDPGGVRDAWRILDGWTIAEVTAGRLGACPLCLDRGCKSCGEAGAA